MFSLKLKRWYSMEIFGAKGARSVPHHSPIFIQSFSVKEGNEDELTLAFFHANYPEGKQEKEYYLRVVHRSPTHLAGVRTDTDQASLVVIFHLEKRWYQKHFPALAGSENVEGTLQRTYKPASTGKRF